MGRAIVRDPAIFLMDEPLSNLDAKMRSQIRTDITALQKRMGTTTVYVTHDQVEAMTLGDRIAVFNNGHIEQLAEPMEMYNKPANEFVAGFIGAPRINLVDRPSEGTAARDHVQLWNMLAPSAAASINRVGLRPEHLSVAPAGQGIPATVELAEHLGDSSIVHLRVAGLSDLLSAKVGHQDMVCNSGDTVSLNADSSRALMFDDKGILVI